MFFVRQQSNKCGLHAIQNLFKSAAIKASDLHQACVNIHEETGDQITNHESYGGDWSVAAVLKAMHAHGYEIKRAVKSGTMREWCVETIEEMMTQNDFRGFIIHQPLKHHFTCIRTEDVDGERHLYYVDSQSDGPIRISTRLATRRCLATAYAWEAFLVKGPEMDFVEPEQTIIYEGVVTDTKRTKFRPSAEFLREWEDLTSQTNKESEQKKCSVVQDTKDVCHFVQIDK
tara:strand:+ start:14021 stop:14710 length:690 start_codon:yes stop_codon:yes gene_type:complete